MLRHSGVAHLTDKINLTLQSWGLFAYQSSHGFLRAVKLNKCHSARPPVSMHDKVNAIRPHSVPSKEPADHDVSPHQQSHPEKRITAWDCHGAKIMFNTDVSVDMLRKSASCARE